MTDATRTGFGRVAAASRLAASVLVAVAAVRLAAVATLGTRGAGKAEPGPPPPPPPAAASAPPARSSRAERVNKAVQTGTPGKSVLVNLVVTAGGRSGVYVDHNYVGKSPYIGDVSCKVGTTVIIQLVPAGGAPHAYKRLCVEGGTIQIGD